MYIGMSAQAAQGGVGSWKKPATRNQLQEKGHPQVSTLDPLQTCVASEAVRVFPALLLLTRLQ
jgi:hypothetical protein